MKDFFEDLGKRLSETAEAVTAKAGDAIEIQKLKAQIRELARGNAEDLMELGQSIYDRFENGEELDEASKGLCEAIASRKESMEEYENKIEGLKGACECTRCGKMVAKDMAFCPYCGDQLFWIVRKRKNVSECISGRCIVLTRNPFVPELTSNSLTKSCSCLCKT